MHTATSLTCSSRFGRLRRVSSALCLAAWLTLCASQSHAVRIKDICTIEGVRENQLVGYGLVVGLNGTGDGSGATFTNQSLASFLRRNNIRVDPTKLQTDNVAAVIVTASLPPFARQGSKIDVVVSTLGDAEDLKGGTLVATPLRPVGAPANRSDLVYAVAQGPVSTGGFAASQGEAAVVKNHPTSGVIPGGGLVEREVPTSFATKSEIDFVLRNPDFTTASRIAQIVNASVGQGAAQARDSRVVSVRVPGGGTDERVRFIAQVESLEVSPDSPARVVYNERTGTIVMGSNVRISTAIITHGNLVFEKQSTPANIPVQSLTPPGTQPILDKTSSIRVTEERGDLQVYEEGVTIGEVARGLNALGVTARDIIAILQSLRECGALQAELVPM
ncbi:flagellar basal body P-ring protein FlgI [Candidatus Sumerlaeota bacterium]|nr:flagellar basal body P-ring protein FlgI [Candidatus Sumerlaeota bacterium]